MEFESPWKRRLEPLKKWAAPLSIVFCIGATIAMDDSTEKIPAEDGSTNYIQSKNCPTVRPNEIPFCPDEPSQ